MFLHIQSCPQWLQHSSPKTNPNCKRFVSTTGFSGGFEGGFCENQRKRELGFRRCQSRAAEKDSEFEIDTEKAREALRKLDQQLQSISQKQQVTPSSPKVRAASSLNNAREEMDRELPDYSGSFMSYLAFSLFIFTMFYNVLFITVIKPSVDGQEAIATTQSIEASERIPLMRFPASSGK